MKKQTPFVKSNFPRKENDDYQTIDTRTVDALLKTIGITKEIPIADCCGNNGSGIINYLRSCGYKKAVAINDAF